MITAVGGRAEVPEKEVARGFQIAHVQGDVIDLHAEQNAGLFLRLSEHSAYPDQIPDAYRGYYVGFDLQTVTIRRLNFGTRVLAEGRCPLRAETPYRIRAAIRGGTIRVWVDGAQVLQTTEDDTLPFGCMRNTGLTGRNGGIARYARCFRGGV